MEVEPYNEGPAYQFGNQTDTDQGGGADFFKAIWIWIISWFTDWGEFGWPDISIPQVDPLFIVLIVMAILMIFVFKKW